MENQKLSLESFATKVLPRNQKTTILGKGGATTLPEIDVDGNITNNVTGSGPGGGFTGPGDGTGDSSGDVKGGIIILNPVP